MVGTILVILLLLWLLGFVQIPWLIFHNRVLFTILGHRVTLWEILLFLVIAWAMESLPDPLRQVAFVLVILWLLSIFGIITIAGLSNMLVVALLIGLALAVFQNSREK